MWKQGIGLKDGVDIPFVGRDIIDPFPIKVDISSRRIQKTGNDIKDGRFSWSRCTEQGIELPFFQFKIDIL